MFLIPSDYFRIVKSKQRGRGVVARRDIPAGTVVGDYLGRLIKDQEVDRLERFYKGECYALHYWGDLSVFPLDVKAVDVHLINNSCTNNCSTFFYYGHSLIFTLRKILIGEELTLDYLFELENNEEYAANCSCGSPLCRGTMYASAESLKKYKYFCRALVKKYKFKAQKEGEVLKPLDSYPKNIKDYSYFDLYANFEARPLVLKDKSLPSLRMIRQYLRQEGRPLRFSSLKLSVLGVKDDMLIVKK